MAAPKKVIKKTKSLRTKKANQISLIGVDVFLVRHLRLIKHTHTVKLIHHRHTSHVSLVLILMIVGIFLYTSNDLTGAVTVNGSVNIGVIVPGPPPTIGAEIEFPVDNTKLIDKYITVVSGTCPTETIIVVNNNSILAGSTNCDDSGKFRLNIELTLGNNIIKALNYDNLNQPGPLTNSVNVLVEKTATSVITIPKIDPTTPVLPTNPSIIPSVPITPDVIPTKPPIETAACDSYNFGELPKSDTPHVSVVCVPRLFGANVDQIMGILVWGGQAPYALSVDLGDESDTSLRSFATSGYYRVAFKYKNPGKFTVAVKVTDHKSLTSVVQAAVVVNGVAVVNPPITTIVDEITKKSWFETPVPTYIMTVGITLGFWGGDLFDRRFGYKKQVRRVKKAA